MKLYKRVKIKKTDGEWTAINKKINGRTFSSYVNSRIQKLNDDFKKCPECITPASGNRIEKVHYVNPSVYESLTLISFKMGISASEVVDRFIINPLLQPE